MHKDWHQFLSARGAMLQDNHVETFSNTADEASRALENSIIADCSDLGLLRFSGEDARSFLHNQLSNDVNGLENNDSRLAAYCNPKGRALAVTRLYCQDDAIYMILPRDILDAVAKRLRMFVLMSKVTIDDVSDEQVILGLAGNDIADKLNAALGDLPADDGSVVYLQNMTLIKLPGHTSRYLLIAKPADAINVWQDLENTASPVGQPAWHLLDIHTGQPQVYASTSEAFVPQMLNMHAIDGISFKKGCYPGQEVVARMYYLGKLKRRMYLAHVETADCPLPGDQLFAAGNDSGQGAGQVVVASPAASGGFDMLVVCPVSTVEAGPVQLGNQDGAEIQFLQLPYDVPLERKAS